LIIPAGNHFRWPEPLRIDGAEISGELVADIQATATVVIKSSGRLFGNVVAGHLVVESGAVFVGQAKIGGTAGNTQTSGPAPVEKPKAQRPVVAEKKVVRRKPAAA